MDSVRLQLIESFDVLIRNLEDDEERYYKTNNDADFFLTKFKKMIMDYSGKICDIFVEFDQEKLNEMRINNLKMFEDFNKINTQLENDRKNIDKNIEEINKVKYKLEQEEDFVFRLNDKLIEAEEVKLAINHQKFEFEKYLNENSFLLVKLKNINRAMVYHKNLLYCINNEILY